MTAVHATLVRLFGHGVLISGEPGTGKSELALGLLDRGHQLVVDDAVHIESRGGHLVGRPPHPGPARLHVHGIGLLDINGLFGPQALAPHAPIVLDLHLDPRSPPPTARELLDGRWDEIELHGHPLPRLTLDPRPHRDLPLLLETVMRRHLQGRGERTLHRASQNPANGRP